MQSRFAGSVTNLLLFTSTSVSFPTLAQTPAKGTHNATAITAPCNKPTIPPINLDFASRAKIAPSIADTIKDTNCRIRIPKIKATTMIISFTIGIIVSSIDWKSSGTLDMMNS